MEHLVAVGGLAVMAVIWFVLQRATGTTETAGRGRCGGCGCGERCEKEEGAPPA
ncbi:MAG: hypothetical protein AMXMBFR64_51240 [Myxococcales bacterium]